MKTTTTFSLIAAIAITLGTSNANAQVYTIDLDKTNRTQTKELYVSPNQSNQHRLMILPPNPPQPQAPRLGFEGQMVYGLGMKVLSVIPGSPAAKVGLEYGDIIVSVNHFPVTSIPAYKNALIEAVQHHQGVVQLNVKNVRGNVQLGIPMYVNVTAYLSGPPTPAIAAATVPQFYNN